MEKQGHRRLKLRNVTRCPTLQSTFFHVNQVSKKSVFSFVKRNPEPVITFELYFAASNQWKREGGTFFKRSAETLTLCVSSASTGSLSEQKQTLTYSRMITVPLSWWLQALPHVTLSDVFERETPNRDRGVFFVSKPGDRREMSWYADRAEQSAGRTSVYNKLREVDVLVQILLHMNNL